MPPSVGSRPQARVAVLLAFIILVDQGLKNWSEGLSEPLAFLGLTIYPHANAGVLGGFFADANPWLIRIFFSVLFGFLLLGGLLLLHFLEAKRAPTLKRGISIYLVGVLGNAWDRMTTGQVIDYVAIPFSGMAFNFADFVVLAGFALIIVSLFREADAIWFGRNSRSGHWVDPKFQRGAGYLVCLVGFAHFFVIALYSFTFLKVFAEDAAAGSAERFVRDYLFGLFVLEGSALLLTFFVSVVFSHRLVGPLIALEKHLEKRRDGKAAPGAMLSLRRGDYQRERIEAISALADEALERKPAAKAAKKD